mmetsp:Transcript_8812/g.34624  ORF Transcript_8812/g.34624 Transcript_8812/m.34624 type:complete len:226 (-) Transcript_8812:63-740(-)
MMAVRTTVSTTTMAVSLAVSRISLTFLSTLSLTASARTLSCFFPMSSRALIKLLAFSFIDLTSSARLAASVSRAILAPSARMSSVTPSRKSDSAVSASILALAFSSGGMSGLLSIAAMASAAPPPIAPDMMPCWPGILNDDGGNWGSGIFGRVGILGMSGSFGCGISGSLISSAWPAREFRPPPTAARPESAAPVAPLNKPLRAPGSTPAAPREFKIPDADGIPP